MPEYLKALIVILGLATAVFAFARAPACAMAMAPQDFARRRNLWFGITLIAFLAHNFWIYIVLTTCLLLLMAPQERNKLAMYFFVLFAVPPISSDVSGLGIMNHFFSINYIRLLALTILLPAFIHLISQPNNERFGRSLPDKLIVGYIVLNAALMLSASTFTNTMRHGVFYAFIDIFLPYYVASRSLKNLQDFRDALMGLALAALVLSAIAVFEYARHWMLYSTLANALGTSWGYGNYMERGDGAVRAQGSTGQPIPLGYVLAVATGFFLYLKKLSPNSKAGTLGLALLVMGMIASMSRGPWLGAAAMAVVFIATGPSALRGYAKVGLLGVVLLPFLLATSVGKELLDTLPFVGTADTESVTYRQRLLEVSIQIILQNPFFGASDYIFSPAMQEMKQGEGIIDLVNTYLSVGLSCGLVGLSLFIGFFIAVAAGIFKSMRALTDRNDDRHLLGQAMLSVLLGIQVIIFTVSSISFIPVIYWSVAGMGVAYAHMLNAAKIPASVPRTAGSAVLSPRP